LDKYLEGLKETAELVVVDHVSIGTDQQVAPGSVQDYSQWVQLVAAMLHGGFTSKRPVMRGQLHADHSCSGG
jgi:membrane dipeptidase